MGIHIMHTIENNKYEGDKWRQIIQAAGWLTPHTSSQWCFGIIDTYTMYINHWKDIWILINILPKQTFITSGRLYFNKHSKFT